MSKRHARLTIYAAIATVGMLLAAALFLLEAADRDRFFVRFVHSWESHWPFEAGLDMPRAFGLPLERVGLIRPARVEVEPGISLRLDPRDLVAQHLLLTGRWEPDTWRIVQDYLPVGGTFVDVGAHIGYYTLKAARRVGPAGRVVAVEPNPAILEELRENLAQSGASRVVSVEPVACADRRSKVDLFVSPRSNTGTASLSRENASQAGDVTGRVSVDALPLDDIVERLDLSRVDVVKMDIEGAELLALRGATRTLARLRPVLVLEVMDRQLRNMGASEQELVAHLRDAGYVRGRAADGNVAWLPRREGASGLEAGR
jgi:FkbM family methyltransferase